MKIVRQSIRKWQIEMPDERFIDLDADQLRMVKEIINRYIPNKKVWVYGSRITQEAQETSDLDLVVFDCSSDEIYDLRENFSKSDVLVSVDIMDWENIPDSFRETIKKEYVVLQNGS